MKNVRMILVALVCALCLTAGSSVSAKPAGHRITAQQKAASDQAMQTGLSDLQAAGSAVQGGNAGQVSASLQAAIGAMQQALPIYKGYRERSIHAADAALKALQTNKKNAEKRVAVIISRAIQDAQTALQTN